MSDPLIEKQKQIYTQQFLSCGDSPEGTFNQHQDIQHLRFQRLLQGLSLTPSSHLHDMGCGLCDLYEYLRSKDALNCIYSGTDIIPEMLQKAQQKYPKIELFCRNILIDIPTEKYDYVVLAGAFNLPAGTPFDVWKEFTRNMIKQMFKMSFKAISFNFLTQDADYYHPEMYYESSNDIHNFCLENLSRFVHIDQAYPLYEFTVTVYHPEFIKACFPQPILDKYLKE